MPWRPGYADSDGERIYWESAGAGVPMVICHGAGSAHLSFYRQVAALASTELRIVTWDQRGYGNSTRTSGCFGIGLAVRDLDSVLAAAGLKHSAIHIVGQAMGAFVAAHWALANPAKTLSLAIWDGPFAASDDGAHLLWKLDPGDKGVQSTKVDRQVGWIRSVGTDFVRRDRAGTFLYQSLQELGNARPGYPETFAAVQAEPVPLDRLRALGVPVLIGRGEFDHVADPDAYVRLATLLGATAPVVLPGAGHSPYFETPDAWNAAMLRHIGLADRSG